MKETRYFFIALILTMLTAFSIYTITCVNNILSTLHTVAETQGKILDKLTAIDDKLHSETENEEITALEVQVQEYAEKVNNMTMDYMTLDEILNQMFGKAQAAYFKEGRAK